MLKRFKFVVILFLVVLTHLVVYSLLVQHLNEYNIPISTEYTCNYFYNNTKVRISPDTLDQQISGGIEGFTYYNCINDTGSRYSQSSLFKKWNHYDIIIFNHVQKTSGSALLMHLYSFCCDISVMKNFCDYFHANSLFSTECENRSFNTHTCKNGGFHSPLSRLSSCYPENTIKFIGMTRDPKERVYSEFGHLQWHSDQIYKMNSFWFHKKYILDNIYEDTITFEDFINYPGNPIHNRQSEILLLSIFSNTIDLPLVRNNWKEYFGLEIEDILAHLNSNKHLYIELLKDITESYFIWFGNVDLYCESFAIFNYIFDTSIPPMVKSESKYTFTKEIADKLEQYNQLDIIFNDYVKQKITQQYKYLLEINYPLANCDKIL